MTPSKLTQDDNRENDKPRSAKLTHSCSHVGGYLKHLKSHTNTMTALSLLQYVSRKKSNENLPAKQLKVPGYQNLEQMIENVQLDVVALCTGQPHAEQTILAAKNGISNN